MRDLQVPPCFWQRPAGQHERSKSPAANKATRERINIPPRTRRSLEGAVFPVAGRLAHPLQRQALMSGLAAPSIRSDFLPDHGNRPTDHCLPRHSARLFRRPICRTAKTRDDGVTVRRFDAEAEVSCWPLPGPLGGDQVEQRGAGAHLHQLMRSSCARREAQRLFVERTMAPRSRKRSTTWSIRSTWKVRGLAYSKSPEGKHGYGSQCRQGRSRGTARRRIGVRLVRNIDSSR